MKIKLNKMRNLLFLILTLFLISCEVPKEKSNEKQITVECTTNTDCTTGGCSGQICGPKDKTKGIITTCEWLEEYRCLKLTSCSCINNKCQWEENNKYRECINKLDIKNI